MIIHIVAWKYREEVPEDARRDHRRRLRALTEVIPDIVSFEVGNDILGLERSYDTGLVARFRDRDALDSYSAHPRHQEVAGFGKTVSENVVSVDFHSASGDD